MRERLRTLGLLLLGATLPQMLVQRWIVVTCLALGAAVCFWLAPHAGQ